MHTMYLTIYAEMRLPGEESVMMRYHVDFSSPLDQDFLDAAPGMLAKFCEQTMGYPAGSVTADIITEEDYIRKTTTAPATDVHIRADQDGNNQMTVIDMAGAKKRCPVCGNTEFLVTAHVTQGWRVGPDGDFIECTAECEEVTHAPDDDDIWVCSACGHDAPGRDFDNPAYQGRGQKG